MKRFELQPSQYGQLGSVAMSCDKQFRPGIKPPFPSRSFSMFIVGAPGSGKSSFTMSLLKRAKRRSDNVYHKTFKHITWVCPRSSRDSIKNCPLSKIPDIYDELSFEVQDKITENRREYGDEDLHQLLVIDDCGATLKHHVDMLNDWFMNRRHLKLSVIILCQYYVNLPKACRSQISHSVLYKPAPGDYDTIRKEFTDMNKRDFEHLASFVWKSKHDNLIISREDGVMYKNLQRIDIH